LPELDHKQVIPAYNKLVYTLLKDLEKMQTTMVLMYRIDTKHQLTANSRLEALNMLNINEKKPIICCSNVAWMLKNDYIPSWQMKSCTNGFQAI
jgi:hypothetical protein